MALLISMQMFQIFSLYKAPSFPEPNRCLVSSLVFCIVIIKLALMSLCHLVMAVVVGVESHKAKNQTVTVGLPKVSCPD